MSMKGQLKFDDLGNIYCAYEKSEQYHSQRVPMVYPCYYCLCNSCVNNTESITISPKEFLRIGNHVFSAIYAVILMRRVLEIWKNLIVGDM